MRIILFDIDGTLLRTHGAGQRASDSAFETLFGKSKSWGDLRADGRTDPDIFDEVADRVLGRALTESERTRLYELYLAQLEKELSASSAFGLLPGVKELCQQLSKKEKTILGLQTGNLEIAAWLKLRIAGIEEFFQFGGFGSDSTKRGEFMRIAVERARQQFSLSAISDVIVIGDTPLDIAGGKQSGYRTIAVATGSYSVEQLHEHAPDLTLVDLSETDRVLQMIDHH